MNIAVFSDVHGNLPALEAVLADIRARKPDRLICAGDLVGYAPFPNEVIEKIRREGIPTVAGNYDDGVGNDRDDCGCAYKDERSRENGQKSLEWTKSHTSPENKAFLASLPLSIRLLAGRWRLLVVHGSPRKINEYLYEDKPESTLRRVIEGSEADILICGHTHIPFHRVIDGKHLINAGSVGKPKHGKPAAVYALLDVDQEVRVDFIELPYDVETTARAIEASELPHEFAQMLREGRG